MKNDDLERLEQLWDKGSTSEYYSQAASLAKAIIAKPESQNSFSQASKLLEQISDKKASADNLGDEDIRIKDTLSQFLVSQQTVPKEVAKTDGWLISEFLGEARKELIPNYKPLPVVANVMPPKGDGLRFTGMRPDAIKDPMARKKYEEAIESNNRNNRMNIRQDAVAHVNRTLTPALSAYLVRLFNEGKINRDQVTKCMNKSRLNRDECSNILKQLNDKK